LSVPDVWRILAEAADRGEPVALATVVGVNGSAPRSSGARMVVWPDGRIAGTVGGGNFEAKVIEAALGAQSALAGVARQAAGAAADAQTRAAASSEEMLALRVKLEAEAARAAADAGHAAGRAGARARAAREARPRRASQGARGWGRPASRSIGRLGSV
jgi:xanthine/CO dehydrogenase XdhC/CoxF family maturation factor